MKAINTLWIGLIFSTLAFAQRTEHPSPDRVREQWQSLNGAWEFRFDDAQEGLLAGWFGPKARFDRQITVPYAFQTELSGIHDTRFHEVVWYRKSFALPANWKGQRILLHFGAVNYEATVWLNGSQLGQHVGGMTPFSFDITPYLAASNRLVVRVAFPSADRSIPRGKAYWKEQSESIFYTRTTGIWQPVWLEATGAAYVKAHYFTPNIDRNTLAVRAEGESVRAGDSLRVAVRLRGELVAQMAAPFDHKGIAHTTLPIANPQLWSPESPTLYDVELWLVRAGKPLDRVVGYAGMRKIGINQGRVLLNNQPYYLKLVLDQGYWPKSLLTPPTEEAILYDIDMIKKFGFNGVRKHQKIEDPRFLYHADRLGLLVWGEMANAYEFTPEAVNRLWVEWPEAVKRDYNHPCVMAWVPINESWGVPNLQQSAPQRDFLRGLYYMTKSLDSTRLVIDNDGWEHTEATDLTTFHDYTGEGEKLAAKYQIIATDASQMPDNHLKIFVKGVQYNHTPIVLTEYGGIAYVMPGKAKEKAGWGYTTATDEEAFLKRYRALNDAIFANPTIAGFCYTQITDVEQEINGLMTYDRIPKVNPELIRQINRGK